MQKARLQNTWDKENKTFNRDTFELRESDKVISGKISVSSKKDNKWVSKAIPFVAFKSQIDNETTLALLHSRGKLFEVEFELMVDSFSGDDGKEVIYFKAVIRSAKFEGSIDDHSKAKGDAYVKEEEFEDDLIDF